MCSSDLIALFVAACGRAGVSAAPATANPDDAIVASNPDDDSGSSDHARELEPTAKLTEHHVTIEGRLAQQDLDSVVADHFSQLGQCFDEGLVNGDDVQTKGAVVVKFEVEPSGNVEHAALELSEYHDHGTENCLVAAVSHWHFPSGAVKDAATVHYPFYLASF